MKTNNNRQANIADKTDASERCLFLDDHVPADQVSPGRTNVFTVATDCILVALHVTL